MTAAILVQIAIACTGVVAIWLSQSGGARARYACLFGLAGQPFWMWSAYSAGQYGILVLTLFYTVAWAKGVHTHWLKRHVFWAGEPGNFYFRVFGYGLAFKDTRRHRLYFSERNGLRPQRKIGHWLIEWLMP